MAMLFPDRRSLYVDFADIEIADMQFSTLILSSPDRCIEIGKQVIREYSENFSDKRYRVNLRIHNLPKDSKVDIRNIRARHLGQMVSVEGLARKVTVVNPKAVLARFTCAKCGCEIWQPQRGMLLSRPTSCPNPATLCNKTANTFILDEINSIYIDSQFIEIQESPEGLRGGQQPERKTGYADDDLCGLVTTGNRITINGIVRSTEKKDNDRSTLFETYLEINSVDFEQHEYDEIEISEEDEKAIIDMSKDPDLFPNIVKSISPTISGLEEVKEAIALQLFGGCHKSNDDGSEIRGDIHILLVGDPGVAKSQLLRYMTSLAPRSIYTSGKSTSGAGLTAAVVKDNEFGDGRWNLEAGALVLADKGLACVDELDKMTPEDRSALHEAMESQRISFAKAGITAVLQCRCSLLAAANPKLGRYDSSQKFSANVDMPPSLISRFDLIFVLTDRPNPDKDHALADFIVGVHQMGEYKAAKEGASDETAIPPVEITTAQDSERYRPPYKKEMLRKYVAYAKRLTPYMSDDIRKMIVDEFVSIRSMGSDGTIAITARQLEAFVRLSEASARMRLSRTIDRQDAQRAISLVRFYLNTIASDGHGGLDIDSFASAYDHNDRTDMQVILAIIRSSGGSSGIHIDDIIAEAGENGISPNVATEIIRRMATTGDIYSPKSDVYKAT